MAILKADIIAMAPELSAVDDAVFTAFIANSAIAFDLNGYDVIARDYVQKNLVAFMMVDAGLGSWQRTGGADERA